MKDIRVSQPDMPPLDEFLPYLEKIWARRWLTNNGEFHQEFEQAIADYLDVPHVSLVANGTLALLLAIQALEIKGEVITTPYSFVATPHSLLWNGIEPVFADISAKTFSLDVQCVEQAITARTSAILAVHCYGFPSDIDGLRSLSERHGLPLIYDAAHCFGQRTRGQSLLSFGDVSVLSFHATKVFHTFEGGAIISSTPEMKQRVDYLRNFGFAGEIEIVDKGINAKMNEMQAAYGLLQLKYVDRAISHRAQMDALYRESLADISAVALPSIAALDRHNHSYFPVLIENGRDELYRALKENGVLCRRYFYPLLSNLDMYSGLASAARDKLPVANRMAEQILCLPMHAELTASDVQRVVSIIQKELG
jgi:dTDP-4-amino-4,6-dideoxygalactose transaminase